MPNSDKNLNQNFEWGREKKIKRDVERGHH
jgi:hypothetical protein